MTITITAFERSPDGGKGLARDTRVRWSLEEVGQPYKVRLVSFRAMKEPAHLALHPFGRGRVKTLGLRRRKSFLH
jgi:glutathione S-transferase